MSRAGVGNRIRAIYPMSSGNGWFQREVGEAADALRQAQGEAQMDADNQIRAMDPMSSGNWRVPAGSQGSRRSAPMDRDEAIRATFLRPPKRASRRRVHPMSSGKADTHQAEAGYPAAILENNLMHGGRSGRAVAFGYRDSSHGPSLRTYTRCQRSAGAHTRRRASRPIAGLEAYGT